MAEEKDVGKQLVFEGCECDGAPTARRIRRRVAVRRPKPERVVIASQVLDAAGLYRDIAATAEKVATAKYGSAGACLGVQMVFPGMELEAEWFEAYIGHREDPSRSEVIFVVVNTDRGQDKPRRSGQERLAA